MNAFTWLWLGWGLAFAVIEGVALVNSRHGDTLSEHVWAWIGIRRPGQPLCPCASDPTAACDFSRLGTAPARTPRWTLRVARTVVLSGLLWLALHLATGGWV